MPSQRNDGIQANDEIKDYPISSTNQTLQIRGCDKKDKIGSSSFNTANANLFVDGHHNEQLSYSLQKSNNDVCDDMTQVDEFLTLGICTYVWIDGSGIGMRSKKRVLANPGFKPTDFPVWNYDGSSTGQATCQNSDVYLIPVAVFRDPFLRDNNRNRIVLCATYDSEKRPLATNHRDACAKHFAYLDKKLTDPWFSIEQEYFMLDYDSDPSSTKSIDDRKRSMLVSQKIPEFMATDNRKNSHYCGAGLANARGRRISDRHLLLCIAAGIKISGTNAEVACGQWEYQIGPCKGIELGDHLWMARYLMTMVAEEFNIDISYVPKLLPDISGSGAHINFSTKEMRDPNGGIRCIQEAIKNLSKHHHKDLKSYDLNNGLDNVQRLTGKHETSDYNHFSMGVANRNVSIRIPRDVSDQGFGYFEDRRPASNVDPYLLMTTMLKSIYCLDKDIDEC